MLAAVVSIVKAVRRFDALSSCACAALVCCAVGGAFDFDWHLPFVGFLCGVCAGLAARTERAQRAEAVAVGPLGRSEVR